MLKYKKIIILGILVCFCLPIAGSVLAQPKETKLEQVYPNLPVIGSLDDANKVPHEERLNFYVKYFVKLAFFLAIAIAIIVLIIAGFAYIAPPIIGKIISITTARTMIRNAFLGLFILATSYLFLYVINPDLLFPSITVPQLQTPHRVAMGPYGGNEAVYAKVSASTAVIEGIDSLGEKVFMDKQGQYFERINEEDCYTDGYSNLADKYGTRLEEKDLDCITPSSSSVSSPPDYVYRAEIPFRDSHKTIGKAIWEIEGKGDFNSEYPSIKSLLDQCTCGLSKIHIDRQALNFECKGGIDPDSYQAREETNVCLTRVSNCGKAVDKDGALLCDLHEVIIDKKTVMIPGDPEPKDVRLVLVKVIEVDSNLIGPPPPGPHWRYLPNEWKPIGWTPRPGWVPEDDIDGEELIPLADSDHIKPERLIKYRVLKLKEIVEELNYQKSMFFPRQVGFLAGILDIETINHIVANVEGGISHYKFLEEEAKLTGEGFEVIVEEVGGSGEAQPPSISFLPKEQGFFQGALARLYDFIKPVATTFAFGGVSNAIDAADTIYFLVHADPSIASPQTIKYNKDVRRNANRANLFSVLTGLTLETIEGFFQGCLTSAFGQATYHLDRTELEEVLAKASEEGVMDRFEAELENRLDQMGLGTAIIGGLDQAIKLDTSIKACKEANICFISDDIDTSTEENRIDLLLRLEQDQSSGTCYECIKNAMKGQKPGARLVSKVILNLLTTDFRNYFEEVNTTLNSKMRYIFFEKGEKIDTFLDSNMIDVYGRIISSAMDKSFDQKRVIVDKNRTECCVKDSNLSICRRVTSNSCDPTETYLSGDATFCCDPDVISPDINNSSVCKRVSDAHKCSSLPSLAPLLDAQMKDILPDIAINQIAKVDNFLECTISGCCRDVVDENECKQERAVVEKKRTECCEVDSITGNAKLSTCYGVASGSSCNNPDKETYFDSGATFCCDPTKPDPDFSDEKQCRRVINRYKCHNENIKVVGGVKQCCQNGITQWMKSHSGDYVQQKTRQYITEPLRDWAKRITCAAGLSAECASINSCAEDWPRRIFKPEQSLSNSIGLNYTDNNNTVIRIPELTPIEIDRYSIFGAEKGLSDYSESFQGYEVSSVTGELRYDEPIPGKCERMTPEDVNTINTTRVPIFEFLDVTRYDNNLTENDVSYEIKQHISSAVDPTDPIISMQVVRKALLMRPREDRKEKICNGAGYSWLCGIRADIDINRGIVGVDYGRFTNEGKCCEETENDDCLPGDYCSGALNDCDMETGEGLGQCMLVGETNAIFEIGYDSTDCECYDNDELTKEIGGAIGVITDVEKTGKSILGGLMRFGAQLVAAFIDTLVHTAIEYAKVAIEDRVIEPLKDAFSTVVDFEQGMGTFLEKSVSEVLPAEISEVLQRSLDGVIADVCNSLRGIPDDQETVTLNLPLPKGVTWEDDTGVDTIEISAKTRRTLEGAFCKVSTHLQTTVLEELSALPEIGTDVDNLLNRSFERHLNSLCPEEDPPCPNDDWECGGVKQTIPACITNVINGSIADIIFNETGLAGAQLEALVRGTPKQIVCGELTTYTIDNGKFKWGIGTPANSIKAKCDAMKIWDKGIFPTIDGDRLDAAFPNLNSEEKEKAKNAFSPWCHFIYVACENPFVGSAATGGKLSKTVGGLIDDVTKNLCEFSKNEAGPPNAKCEGLCSGDCVAGKNCIPDERIQNDNSGTCTDYLKNSCASCSYARKNSVAFSLIYHAVEQDFGPVALRITPEQIEDEKNIYRWFLVEMSDLSNEIHDVAIQRGFTETEWSGTGGIVITKSNHNINQSSISVWAEGMLRDIVAWRLTGTPTLKQVITKIPFGIIKGTGDEETLLSSNGGRESQNFLGKKPYDILKNYACKKVESSFAEKYPMFTLEALRTRPQHSIPGVLSSYTIESVQNLTTAEKLDFIAHFQTEPPVDDDLRGAYIFCKMLDLNPAQAFGLDQTLKNYIKPEEFKILFDLINQEMMPSERPEGLNRLLSDMNSKTPVSVIGGLEVKLLSEPEPDIVAIDALRVLKGFLSKKIGEQIRGAMNERIIDKICKLQDFQQQTASGSTQSICDWQPDEFTDMDKIWALLRKTPMEIVKDNLKDKITPPPFDDINTSFMETMALNSAWGVRYIDSLAGISGLDGPIFQAAGFVNKTRGWVNHGVKTGVSALQQGLETALIEYPKRAGAKIAEWLSEKMGSKLAGEIAGKCYVPDKGDSCSDGFIRKVRGSSVECCSLGGPNVCNDLCRVPADSEECDFLRGEVQEYDGVTRLCCFKFKDKECTKCRPVTADVNVCRVTEDPLTTERKELITTKAGTYNTCCHNEKYLSPEDQADDITTSGVPKCCTSVANCVADKFADHMEAMADMMAEGFIPVRLKKEK